MEDHLRIPAETEQLSPQIHLLLEAHQAAGAEDDGHGGGGSLDRQVRCLETFFRLPGFYRHPLPWFPLLPVPLPPPRRLRPVAPLPPLKTVRPTRDAAVGARRRSWSFDVFAVASQASLAAVSLRCVSHNLRKYGMRRFLFVDKSYEGINTVRGQDQGVIAKTSEVPVLLEEHTNLCCCLSKIKTSEVPVLLEEHTNLCYCLSKISHRFRGHLLLVFLISVASQFL